MISVVSETRRMKPDWAWIQENPTPAAHFAPLVAQGEVHAPVRLACRRFVLEDSGGHAPRALAPPQVVRTAGSAGKLTATGSHEVQTSTVRTNPVMQLCARVRRTRRLDQDDGRAFGEPGAVANLGRDNQPAPVTHCHPLSPIVTEYDPLIERGDPCDGGKAFEALVEQVQVP